MRKVVVTTTLCILVLTALMLFNVRLQDGILSPSDTCRCDSHDTEVVDGGYVLNECGDANIGTTIILQQPPVSEMSSGSNSGFSFTTARPSSKCTILLSLKGGRYIGEMLRCVRMINACLTPFACTDNAKSFDRLRRLQI